MGLDWEYCSVCGNVRLEGYIHGCGCCDKMMCDDCAKKLKIEKDEEIGEWVTCPYCMRTIKECPCCKTKLN